MRMIATKKKENIKRHIHQVEQIAQKTFTILQSNPFDDTDTETTTTTKDPNDVITQLTSIRNEMISSWKQLKESSSQTTTTATTTSAQKKLKSQEEEESFKSIYVNSITNAFSEELEAIRSGTSMPDDNNTTPNTSRNKKGKKALDEKNKVLQDTNVFISTNKKEVEEEIDIDVLVECLSSGMDLLSQDEKELIMEEQELLSQDEKELIMEEQEVEVVGRKEKDVLPHDLRREKLGFGMRRL